MSRFDEFEILGVPAPQGSKTRMPNGATIEGSSTAGRAKIRAWRQAVSAVARDIAGDEPPIDEPLGIEIEFRLPMPKSRPKAARAVGRWPHQVKPDIDKLLRATLDGLTDGGLIRDDSRIVAVGMEAWEVVGWTGALVRLSQFSTQETAA